MKDTWPKKRSLCFDQRYVDMREFALARLEQRRQDINAIPLFPETQKSWWEFWK